MAPPQSTYAGLDAMARRNRGPVAARYLEVGKTRDSLTIPGLDGLRAISILLVMISHSGLQSIVPGVFGVTIFFFISGFLITWLLIEEHRTTGAISIKRFYLRRVLRLYPPLLIYVVAMSAIWAIRGFSPDYIGLLGALFYFANYLYAISPEHVAVYGAHLWSLSVEEHFYLFFPLLFALGIGSNKPALGLLIATALVIRLLETYLGASDTYASVATECRYDSILAGCLTAVLVNDRGAGRLVDVLVHPAVVIIALCAILSTFVVRDPIFRQTFRFTIQNVALVPIVVSAVFTPRYRTVKAVLNWQPVTWIGVLSYSLYLWHYALFDLAKAVLVGVPAVIQYAVGWLLASAVAIAIYFMVERPMFKLRKMVGSKAHENIAAGLESNR